MSVRYTISDAYGCTTTASVLINSVDLRCGNKLDKVTICHRGKTLCISAADVQEHLAHGDYLGSCTTTAETTSIFAEEGEKTSLLTTRVYPNPASDVINIQLGAEVQQVRQIAVLDLSGRPVVLKPVNGQNVVVISLKQLPAGVYVVQIRGSQLLTFKLVKQ